MNDDNPWPIVAAIVAALIFVAVLGYQVHGDLIEREAVKEGRAKWIAGPDGEAKFQWCDCTCK